MTPPFEPSRTPLGAFLRSGYGARARKESAVVQFPLGTKQPLAGLMYQERLSEAPPSAYPNCWVDDPTPPPGAGVPLPYLPDCMVAPGDQYMISTALQSPPNWAVFVYDMGRNVGDPADWGPPVQIGAECYSYASPVPGPPNPPGYAKAAIVQGAGNSFSWYGGVQGTTGSYPNDPTYFVNALPTVTEELVTETFDIPESAITPGVEVDLIYLRFVSPEAPFIYDFDVLPGSGMQGYSTELRRDTTNGTYWVLAYDPPATRSSTQTLTFNVYGYAHPGTATQSTITINWT